MKAQLSGLAETLSELRERVRVAVAGELGRAVGDAVRQVVQAVVAGNTKPPAPQTPASRWHDEDDDDRDGWGRPRDPWHGRDDEDDYGRRTPLRREPSPDESPAASASVPAAIAAGVFVTRWWLLRRGTLLAAAGLGVGVGLLGMAGGPLARAAVAVLAATAEVLNRGPYCGPCSRGPPTRGPTSCRRAG
jgi:hypothetical protein